MAELQDFETGKQAFPIRAGSVTLADKEGEGEQCVRAICMWPELALSLFGDVLGWLFWLYIACGVVIGRPRLLPLLCCLTLKCYIYT